MVRVVPLLRVPTRRRRRRRLHLYGIPSLIHTFGQRSAATAALAQTTGQADQEENRKSAPHICEDRRTGLISPGSSRSALEPRWTEAEFLDTITKMGTKKILVADDEESIQELFGAYLTQAGFQVEFADSGTAALKKLESKEHHLLILDVMMPGKSGVAVINALLKRSQTYPPIIVVSGQFVKNEDRTVFLEYPNVDGYLTKPVDHAQFMTAVQTALQTEPPPNTALPDGHWEV